MCWQIKISQVTFPILQGSSVFSMLPKGFGPAYPEGRSIFPYATAAMLFLLLKEADLEGAQITTSFKSPGLLYTTKCYFFYMISAHLDVAKRKVKDLSVVILPSLIYWHSNL